MGCSQSRSQAQRVLDSDVSLKGLVRLRKPAAGCLNRRWITAHAHPRDKGAALRFAAVFVQLKFGVQRRTLQSRLMMRQRDKIVGEFATGILTARNIGRYSKAEYGDVCSYISCHWLCRSKRDDKISRVIL
jgi:hypothetical protein